jgi:iron complex outermembrane recepter protein
VLCSTTPGFNRVPSAGTESPCSPFGAPWQQQATAHGGWRPPLAFAPDDLTNNELGWKTQWLDQRIQWDGAIYQEDWNHAQIGLFANHLMSYTVVINGGDYRVRGIETSAAARVTTGLTIEVSGNWNHSELVRQAPFVWADGTPVDFDTLQTADGQKVSNPGGALGSPLAGAPPFKGNIRARYEIIRNGYDAFVQLGAVHQSHSFSTTDQLTLDLQGKSIAYDLPPFTAYDAALGVGKAHWCSSMRRISPTHVPRHMRTTRSFTNQSPWFAPEPSACTSPIDSAGVTDRYEPSALT